MAAQVSIDEVRNVARLARLGVTDDRARDLMQDLNTILRHMEALRSVDTTGADEAAGIGAAGMRLRKDDRAPIPMDEPLASIAPEVRDGLIIVPRLATHEDVQESSA
jgi:aspartyl-tRNA(Asn)/glutamyl-tRNA(Gln) amidotransferase subunit C